MTPSLEGWPANATETPFPHEVRLTPLDPNPVLQCQKLWCVVILELEIWLKSHLTTCWLLPKNVLFKVKFPFMGLSSTDVQLPFFQNYMAFFRNAVVGKWNRKINYIHWTICKIEIDMIVRYDENWLRVSLPQNFNLFS